MLKSMFLLVTCIILFSGCHRYHHNVRTIISPTVIFKPFHFNTRYNHGYRGHKHHYHRGYYSNRRGRGH
jgi:hypothetical protein